MSKPTIISEINKAVREKMENVLDPKLGFSKRYLKHIISSAMLTGARLETESMKRFINGRRNGARRRT